MSEDSCGETCKRANLCYACSKELGGWQGLTDDELREMLGYGKDGYIPDYTRNFVDAIEAKLKEKNT